MVAVVRRVPHLCIGPRIENCFDRSSVQDWIDLAFSRLGYTADDPLTWVEAKVHLPF